MRRLLRRFFGLGTGHDSALWPVLLLVAVVLVPSAGVVWMMCAAMENERLAVRQRLADAYGAQLETARCEFDQEWLARLARIDSIVADHSPAQSFAECVRDGLVDSVVILDEQSRVAYPSATDSAAHNATEGTLEADWRSAERLEFDEHRTAEAAESYKTLAERATNVSFAAQARQAQARALAKAGDNPGAIAVLQALRTDSTTTDNHGRLLAADAELRLLELLNRDSDARREVAAGLAKRLNDYSDPRLPTDQRQFLMHALVTHSPSTPLPTLAAEELAANYLSRPHEPISPGAIAATDNPKVLEFRIPSGCAIGLILRPHLHAGLTNALRQQPFPEGVVATARDTSQGDPPGDELVAVSLAPQLPRWQLAVALDNTKSFDATADTRMAYLLATGVVVVAITAALALLVANMLREQARLTRLKNDLVATVSHELKTPLASIRLLVDTLLDAESSPDAPFGENVRAREYLELIAKENTRLSRLIDNFLTFSRMERGKHRFDFQPADGATIVDQAVAAVADRFDGVTNSLAVHLNGPLPLEGDEGALATVVVNLLDNAWKYSDEPRKIAVTAAQVGRQIMISVADNGIGLSPRAVRKVFDRFYQVDQHVSRSHDGCGLGLSIVKYIVEAHGGQVAVESRLGAGTKFTVSLPADAVADHAPPPPARPVETHA